MEKCPVCGSRDIKNIVGDFYVCRDCLSEFSIDGDVKYHRSASEEYAHAVFMRYVYAAFAKDKEELKELKKDVERLKMHTIREYFDYNEVIHDIDMQIGGDAE